MYATSLDLNMGYYHIELSPNSSELCTIVLPWGKYEYLRLPMGLCNSPDIFQEKMSELMYDLEYVRTYLDDILCITNSTWEDHLNKLDKVLTRLEKAGLKVNARKSFFGQTQLEYLGYWITRNGIQPLPKKVEAVQNIAIPKTRKELRRFIGIINYYRDMWVHRSDILAPLTALTSKTTKWLWTDEHTTAFNKVKQLISREVILAYPDFELPFDIHTDASDLQLGSVLSQNGKPIAFYSRKLNPAQKRYTTTERELLAIVETLKEYRNILLGQRIRVYTDHKNLTYTNFNTERVMRWRLILEEYGPELIYTQGKTNIVADALSRLNMNSSTSIETDMNRSTNKDTNEMLTLCNAQYFGIDKSTKIQDDSFPLTFSKIYKAQKADIPLQKLALTHEEYSMQSFRGGEKHYDLIMYQNKIVIPKILHIRAVQWYHQYLCHPGETRTECTIRQNFWWKNLTKTVHTLCTSCDTCQRLKKSAKKYGHLPPKEAESIPWDRLCIDLIGPYTIVRKNKSKQSLVLWALTMIDPVTGWFEMREIKTKQADYIANVLEQAWLSRYPWPTTLVFDRGSEFKAEVTEMLRNDYGIKVKTTTTRNPQANAIIERVHQTIGNMIKTFQVYDNDALDDGDPWSGILAAVMAAVRSTFSTTTQATPMQLVFGRDTILNTKFMADWNYIHQRKQKLIEENNRRENAKRILHTYRIGDKVLVKQHNQTKYGGPEYDGPYPISAVNANGTVRVRKSNYYDIVNIRNIKPYTEST
jgi:transposase InsO family protein